MPERLPRELRALYGFAHWAATEPHPPEGVVERLCDDVRATFGFRHVRPIAVDSPDAREAIAQRGAVVSSRGVVVPLLVAERVLACIAAEGPGTVDDRDLQLLSALGHLSAVLVEKAERDDELERALASLLRADRVKSDFISTASHELRAPVTVVHGIASTLHLRAAELSPAQIADLSAALHVQSGSLRDLIEQLLDLSRVESGAFEARPCRFGVREWLDGVLARVAPDRRADVDVRLDPALELETDPDAFERVVGNLIGNALRHGGPPVVVRSREGETFCLIVEDAGDGVAREFVRELFERFTSSEASRRRNSAGAGLGLSIARSFAEALGGSLYYEDAEPRGARFVLELRGAPVTRGFRRETGRPASTA